MKTTPEPDTEPVLLAAYARGHIDSLSRIEERTRADYHRDLERHLIPSFGTANLREKSELPLSTSAEWSDHLQAEVPDPRTPINPHNGEGFKSSSHLVSPVADQRAGDLDEGREAVGPTLITAVQAATSGRPGMVRSTEITPSARASLSRNLRERGS